MIETAVQNKPRDQARAWNQTHDPVTGSPAFFQQSCTGMTIQGFVKYAYTRESSVNLT